MVKAKLAPNKPTSIDLFCGAGGLTAALERAGWSTCAAVDVDKDAIATLKETQAARVPIPGRQRKHYLQDTKILLADIRSLSSASLIPEGAPSGWRPDLLVGGPPCQPFSSAGAMKGLEDPRGTLFLEFVRLARELKPRFILFENVAGLVTAKTPEGVPGGVLLLVQRSFEEIGYACRFELLNAADFGASQRRIRLFMIASLSEALPEFPDTTHSRDVLSGLSPWVNLGEFLKTRPRPRQEDIVLPSESRAAELAQLKPGTGIRSNGIVEANRPGGHWGYRQDCFLADLTLPARTIRAASTPDWVKLPRQAMRRLTWLECAGLQGFPDGWAFSGTSSSRFKQIGNAVQGNVGEALGAVLLASAQQNQAQSAQSHPWPAAFHRRVRYTQMEAQTNGAHRENARLKGSDKRPEPDAAECTFEMV